MLGFGKRDRKKLVTERDQARWYEYERRQALLDTKFLSSTFEDGQTAAKGQAIRWDDFLRAVAMNQPLGSQATARLTMRVPAFIAETFAELLFLEKPEIASRESVDAETEWIERFCDENELDEQFLEDALDASGLGEVYWKLRIEEGGELPIVDTLEPRWVLPRFESLNGRRVDHYDILAKLRTTGKREFEYLVETQYRGRIEYATVRVNDAWEVLDERPGATIETADGTIELPDSEPTGVEDEFLVIHVPNYRKSRRVEGVSDFDGMLNHFDEINNRVSALATALDVLARPKLQGTGAFVDSDGRFPFSSSKYFPLEDGDVPISAIVWDPQVMDHLAAIDALIERALGLAGIWPGLFDPDKGGQAESGRAMRMRMMKTRWKTRKKQRYFGAAIEKLVYVAEQLQSANGGALGFEPATPKIRWFDIIPEDDLEVAQSEAIKTRAGIGSRKAAVRNLNPSASATEIDDELEAIDDDASRGEENLIGASGRTNPPGVPAGPRLPASL